jgi:N-acetyl-gamma-glutamyl-phosphate reductase
MEKKLQTAVLGATGYAGAELARILLKHPRLTPPVLFAREGSDASIGSVAPNNGSALPDYEAFSWDAAQRADLLFLATPHETSWDLVPQARKRGIRVIDLSGAWRLMQENNRAIYNLPEQNGHAALLQQSVYGLPELHASAIASADLVANPGCYATSVILALAPLATAGLLDTSYGIVCDCKSGVSGAGKAPTQKTHFVEVADNLSAYSVFAHRHTGEILEQLGLQSKDIIFTPHLLPIPRGILSTIYVRLNSDSTAERVEQTFRTFYSTSRFVRIFPSPQLPQIQHSLRTNHCDIGMVLAPDRRRMVIVSCLDNLVKGAAGQAVQNMNLMFGWPEWEGLD